MAWILNAKCGNIYIRICFAAHSNQIDLNKIIDLSLRDPAAAEKIIRDTNHKFADIKHHNGINWENEFDPDSEKKLDKIICVGRDPLKRFLSCFLMHAYRVMRVPITYENENQKEEIANDLNFENFVLFFENGFPDYYPEWLVGSAYRHLRYISHPSLVRAKSNIIYLDISEIDDFLLSLGIRKTILEKTFINYKLYFLSRSY